MVSAVNYSISVDSGVRRVGGGRQIFFPAHINQDPTYPQTLAAGSVRKFPAGTGDPEGFLYLSDAAQDAILDNIIAQGGDTLYVIAVRDLANDKGDGSGNETPWPSNNPANGLDSTKMARWRVLFERCRDNGITVFFFYWDDHDATSGQVFPGGDTSPSGEQTFLTALTEEFADLTNLIIMVGEEATEGFSVARVSDQAAVIRAANANALIGAHQNDGNTYLWPSNANLKIFGVQLNDYTDDDLYDELAAIWSSAVSNGYCYAFIEDGHTGPTGAAARRRGWIAFMAGACAYTIYQLDPSTATTELQDCKRLKTFVESTTWYTMAPNNNLIVAGAKYLRANAGQDYLAWQPSYSAAFQISGMTAGAYTAHWQACDADQSATVSNITVTSGTNSFSKPGAITSNEVAVWLERN